MEIARETHMIRVGLEIVVAGVAGITSSGFRDNRGWDIGGLVKEYGTLDGSRMSLASLRMSEWTSATGRK